MSIVRVNSLKYGNSLNYEWETTLLEHAEKHVIVKGDINRKLIHHGRGKIFTMENPVIEFFPLDQWYTASVEKTVDNLMSYYCNICMPSNFTGSILSFIDLDFDVIKQPGGDWTLVDEDEFTINSRKYGYPLHLIDKAVEEKNRLLHKIHNRLFPFDGWLEELVNNHLG